MSTSQSQSPLLADDPAVLAAFVRLEARLQAPERPAIKWIRWGWGADLARECAKCGRRPRLLLHRVTHRRPRWVEDVFTEGRRLVDERASIIESVCADGEECQRWRDRQREVRTRRTGVRFVLAEPAAPDAPLGTCKWCGEAIVLIDPTDYRRARREYHRGDSHEEGDRNCQLEYWRSYTYDNRTAVVRRDLRDYGAVFCADCGLICVEKVDDPSVRTRHAVGSRELPGCEWEADHHIPLEDGGDHSLDNLRCRCVPCHRTKTARENRARRARRRGRPVG